MERDALQFLLITQICLLLLVVVCVVAAWRWVFRYTPRPKRQPSQPTTGVSESRLAELATDQAALFSTLDKLTTTVKRLSSRQGMQDVRARQEADQADPPPKGTPKAELLRYYGMSGKVGPDFARAQQQFELRNNDKLDS